MNQKAEINVGFQHQAHKCTDLHARPVHTHTPHIPLHAYIMTARGIVVVHTVIVVAVVVRPKKA